MCLKKVSLGMDRSVEANSDWSQGVLSLKQQRLWGRCICMFEGCAKSETVTSVLLEKTNYICSCSQEADLTGFERELSHSWSP